MIRLQSIDPGKATGVAFGFYDEDTPYTFQDATTLQNGVAGVAEVYWNADEFLQFDTRRYGHLDDFEVVLENFIVRPHQPADPIALEVIGFVKGVSSKAPNMRLRSDKAKVPDSLLKEFGLWQTGSMVGHKDGRDANDAIIHAISWLAFKERHQPTIDFYFPDMDV